MSQSANPHEEITVGVRWTKVNPHPSLNGMIEGIRTSPGKPARSVSHAPALALGVSSDNLHNVVDSPHARSSHGGARKKKKGASKKAKAFDDNKDAISPPRKKQNKSRDQEIAHLRQQLADAADIFELHASTADMQRAQLRELQEIIHQQKQQLIFYRAEPEGFLEHDEKDEGPLLLMPPVADDNDNKEMKTSSCIICNGVDLRERIRELEDENAKLREQLSVRQSASTFLTGVADESDHYNDEEDDFEDEAARSASPRRLKSPKKPNSLNLTARHKNPNSTHHNEDTLPSRRERALERLHDEHTSPLPSRRELVKSDIPVNSPSELNVDDTQHWVQSPLTKPMAPAPHEQFENAIEREQTVEVELSAEERRAKERKKAEDEFEAELAQMEAKALADAEREAEEQLVVDVNIAEDDNRPPDEVIVRKAIPAVNSPAHRGRNLQHSSSRHSMRSMKSLASVTGDTSTLDDDDDDISVGSSSDDQDVDVSGEDFVRLNSDSQVRGSEHDGQDFIRLNSDSQIRDLRGSVVNTPRVRHQTDEEMHAALDDLLSDSDY